MRTTAFLPSSDVDSFTDEVLHDPYPALCELREAGPAVRLTGQGSPRIPSSTSTVALTG